MTIEQLVVSPISYFILLGAWCINSTLKYLVRAQSWRGAAWFKLALTVIPILLGAALGTLMMDQDASSWERALAGAGAAAPAVVSYNTFRQISEIPSLPAPHPLVAAGAHAAKP